MYSKYAGECRTCGESFPKGEPINWSRAGGAVHVVCPRSRAENQTAPCWDCKSPGGRFRRYGAATPVYCDACEAKNRASQFKAGNVIIDAPHPDDEEAGAGAWLEDGEEDQRFGLEPGTLASDRRLARRGLTVVRFAGGGSMTQNSRGRCEDAPCCGCCS